MVELLSLETLLAAQLALLELGGAGQRAPIREPPADRMPESDEGGDDAGKDAACDATPANVSEQDADRQALGFIV
jgi:predicted small lipoprotein YifL